MQSETAECGLANIAMVAAYWGSENNMPILRRKFAMSLQGTTLTDLTQIAGSMGFMTRVLKSDLGGLRSIALPAILHWDFNHFVVLVEVRRKSFVVHDPAVGRRVLSVAQMSRGFTGVVLELQPSDNFKIEKNIAKIGFRTFLTNVRGLYGPGLQLLILSILAQAIMMIAPLFLQVTVDTVIQTSDLVLLNVLLLGFGILHVIGPLLEWTRSRLLIFVGTQFSAQMTRNLVSFLFSLPLSYFESRNIGDVIVRLGATEEIRRILTQGVLALMLDTVFLLFAIVIMFSYSIYLSLIVLLGAVLLGLARFLFIPSIRRIGNEVLQKQGQQQSVLLESIKGVGSIKLGNREVERNALWDNKFSTFVESAAELQSLKTGYGLVSGLATNLCTVFVLYFGARAVMDPDSAFSLGAFFAYNAYTSMFLGRISSFFDQLMDISTSRIHLERLADIHCSRNARSDDQIDRRPSVQDFSL